MGYPRTNDANKFLAYVSQLGAYLCTPSPMTSDGLDDHGDGKESIDHIKNMLSDMCLHPENPDPKIMNLDKYWHPKFNWYGPAGIGACRVFQVLEIGIKFLF